MDNEVMEKDKLNISVYSIKGSWKSFSNYFVACLLAIYFVVLLYCSFPWSFISSIMWIYGLGLIILIIIKPEWWLFSVFLFTAILSLIPNWQGVSGLVALRGFRDGSFISLSHLNQMKTLGHDLKGINSLLFSIPVFGLPGSMGIWWLKQKEVFLPKSFPMTMLFGLSLLVFFFMVFLKYYHITLFPLNLEFIRYDIFREISDAYLRLYNIELKPQNLFVFGAKVTAINIVGILFFMVLFNIVYRGISLNIVKASMILITITSFLYVLGQHKGWFPVFSLAPQKFESVFSSIGDLSSWCGVTSALFLCLIFTTSTKKLYILYTLIFIVSILNLSASQSRTALLGLLFSFFSFFTIYQIVKYRNKNITIGKLNSNILWIIVFTIFAGIIFISLPTINNTLQEHINQEGILKRIVNSFDFSNKSINTISSERIPLWGKCLLIWKEYPLTGCGTGQLPWQLLLHGYQYDPYPADNQFLLEISERGIIGLIIFLGMLLYLLKDIFKPIKNMTTEGFLVWIPWTSVVIGILFQFFTVYLLFYNDMPFFIWGFFAIAVGISYRLYDEDAAVKT